MFAVVWFIKSALLQPNYDSFYSFTTKKEST